MNAQQTGNLINFLRTKKNLTQKELAEMINVSDKAVSKWERGDGCPDVSIIPALANALGVATDSILEGNLSEEDMNKLYPEFKKKIKVYDFKRPDKWSREQFRIVWNLFEKIGQQLESEFSTMSKFPVDIRISAVDQLTNIEFQHSIPETCFISEYRYNQMSRYTVEIDPAFGKALLKQDSTVYPDIQSFDSDVMHNYFANKISEKIQNQIIQRLVSLGKSSADIEDNIRNPKSSYTTSFASLLQEPNMMCMLVSFECHAGNAQGYINIQVGELIMQYLNELDFFSTGFPEVKFEYLNDIKSPDRSEQVTVEFGRFSNVNVELEKGKILIIEKKYFEPLNLVYKNRVIHTGEVVVVEENLGLRITDKDLSDITYDEENYLSIQLGNAQLLPEEIEKLKADNIVTLKQMAGQPSAIIKNGKVVALGEIVVADNNFGIRIITC